jgi:hypothetical protein
VSAAAAPAPRPLAEIKQIAKLDPGAITDVEEALLFGQSIEFNEKCAALEADSEERAALRGELPCPSCGEFACSRCRELLLVRASGLRDEALEWDDYPFFARGCPTWIEGAPEMGKTTLLCDSIAQYTQRGESVIVHADEDSYSLLWKPRLLASEANLDRIHLITGARDEQGRIRSFSTTDDGDLLARRVRELGVRRVFLDSLIGSLGSRVGRPVDTHREGDVRQALRPLLEIGCGVTAIRHFRKARGTDPANAGGGSIAFYAVARIVLAVFPDPQDPTRRLLAVSKNNLVPAGDKVTRAFRLVPSKFDPKVPRVEWDGSSDVTAEEALEAMAEQEADARGGEKSKAKAFLLELLASGPVRSTEVLAKAKQDLGLAERTVWRAKAALKRVRAHSAGGVWYWSLKE